MSPVKFKELPFRTRPDLTPYLIHLTRSSSKRSGLENLVNILKTGVIRGTLRYIRGSRPAACFMDVPFLALKYVCTEENASRYEQYGVIVSKRTAYERGVRPVLYLSPTEEDKLEIPDGQLWKVVRLEVSEDGWISWLHEREWRCPNKFELPEKVVGVMVNTLGDVEELQEQLADDLEEFKSVPRCILPLSVVCQGLNL